MTTVTPTPAAPPERVLQLLAAGTTTVRTAELTHWPRQRILKLISTQKGWLVDPERDVVTMPGKRRGPTPTGNQRATRPTPPPAQAGITVHVSEIEPSPRNIRKKLGDLTELADSIRQHGILQPLVVEPHPTRPRGYRLLAGHRRLAAAQVAGLGQVPVIVRAAAGVDTAIEVMLIENCHRQDLTPMEKAIAFGQLRDLGHRQQQIADRTGFAVSTVSYYLTLLELDDASQDKVRAGELSAADAVQGVRRVRAQARKSSGGHREGHHNKSWEPDHFSESHPLAGRARRLCDRRGHPMRRRYGGACGECWESVIRLDEREVIEAEEADG